VAVASEHAHERMCTSEDPARVLAVALGETDPARLDELFAACDDHAP
jgi:hypothetical protein